MFSEVSGYKKYPNIKIIPLDQNKKVNHPTHNSNKSRTPVNKLKKMNGYIMKHIKNVLPNCKSCVMCIGYDNFYHILRSYIFYMAYIS